MFDHVGFRVRNLEASRKFYVGAGPARLRRGDGEANRRRPGPRRQAGAVAEPGEPPASPLHIAFAAANREEVDAFHAAALGAGGKDNGPPGLRPHYHPNYYGAFAIDPDGHNIEAVCHSPAP